MGPAGHVYYTKARESRPQVHWPLAMMLRAGSPTRPPWMMALSRASAAACLLLVLVLVLADMVGWPAIPVFEVVAHSTHYVCCGDNLISSNPPLLVTGTGTGTRSVRQTMRLCMILCLSATCPSHYVVVPAAVCKTLRRKFRSTTDYYSLYKITFFLSIL